VVYYCIPYFDRCVSSYFNCILSSAYCFFYEKKILFVFVSSLGECDFTSIAGLFRTTTALLCLAWGPWPSFFFTYFHAIYLHLRDSIHLQFLALTCPKIGAVRNRRLFYYIWLSHLEDRRLFEWYVKVNRVSHREHSAVIIKTNRSMK
jgi:hypothetical protein